MKYVWRFRVLYYWLIGKRNGVSFKSLSQNIAAPRFKNRAEKYIETMEEDSDNYLVKIKDCKSILYFPKVVGLDALYHVIPEICDKKDWHYYEVPQTQVKINDIVVDCGAAEGLFSLTVKDRCQYIYIIEPSPFFIKSLNKTFRNSKNIDILQVAVGSSQGQKFITSEGMETKISDAPTDQRIMIETIDNLFFKKNKRITYIKADLEGYETKMLSGAQLTIKNYRPTLAITTYHNPEDVNLITSFLRNICPEYIFLIKGIESKFGAPVMLHAWID